MAVSVSFAIFDELCHRALIVLGELFAKGGEIRIILFFSLLFLLLLVVVLLLMLLQRFVVALCHAKCGSGSGVETNKRCSIRLKI